VFERLSDLTDRSPQFTIRGSVLQVPMSKFEANEFVDDRYAKMSERLEVRRNVPPQLLSIRCCL
jgi:hypothetical protein